MERESRSRSHDQPHTRLARRRPRQDPGDGSKSDGAFKVCGEAHDADGAVDMAEECRPDVRLLDINMPGSGMAAASRITAMRPDTAVVMLTSILPTGIVTTPG